MYITDIVTSDVKLTILECYEYLESYCFIQMIFANTYDVLMMFKVFFCRGETGIE
jgi:hypothetical protein